MKKFLRLSLLCILLDGPLAVANPLPDAPAANNPAPETSQPTVASFAAQARSQIDARLLDEASHTLQQGLEVFPDSALLLRLKGALERRQGNNAAALITHEALAKADPANEADRSVLALLLADAATRAPPQDAAAMLARAMPLSDYNADITAAYCLAAARVKQPEAVIAAYEHLDAPHREHPSLLTAAAASYRELERFDDAATLYDRLLTASPKDPALADAYVDALLKGQSATTGARVAAAAKRHPDCLPLLRAYVQWCLDHGEPWRGLQTLTQVLIMAPDEHNAANQRVALLADLGCATLARDFTKTYNTTIDVTVQQRVRTRMAEAEANWRRIDSTAGAPSDLQPGLQTEPTTAPKGLLTLDYGDITEEAAPGSTSVDLTMLIQQIEYLRGHGFKFVSDRDVSAARRGKKPLPARAALLLFHGGFASFAERVMPVLEQYHYPALLAIPTAKLEQKRVAAPTPALMTWEQVRTLAANPMLTLVSMSHSLDNVAQSNPQGRLAPAAHSCLYLPQTSRYETVDEYRERITADLKTSQRLLASRTGRVTDILLWPEGVYNHLTLDAARMLDYGLMFAAETPNMPRDTDVFPTFVPVGATTLENFACRVWQWGLPPKPDTRPSLAMPLNLASVIGSSADQTRANLSTAVERAVSAGVDTVYLSACTDENGDGAAESAFFPNRTLPMKADLLDHAASLLRYRGIEVVVVMPVLGIHPPVKEPDQRLLVMEFHLGQVAPDPWRFRLTPFHPEALRMIRELHEDLAAHVDLDNVLFGRDAYLTDFEDGGPMAAAFAREKAGIHERNPKEFSPDQRQQWVALKSVTIGNLLDDLQAAITLWHPSARFGRFLYAPVLLDPIAREWFTQDYQATLAKYHFVCVDANPELYATESPLAWLHDLAAKAAATPQGIEKTVFCIPLLQDKQEDWLSKSSWTKRTVELGSAGARHMAFEPDLPLQDTPSLSSIQAVHRAIDRLTPTPKH